MITYMGIVMAVGILAGYFAGRAVGEKVALLISSSPRARTMGSIGAWLAALPAFFASFVVGGTFGGGVGEVLIGRAGIPIGVGVGIAVVLAAGITAGACLGAFIGGVLFRGGA